MTEANVESLSEVELDAGRGELMPDREAMSFLLPGATLETPAADILPVEAQTWHGSPDQLHIM